LSHTFAADEHLRDAFHDGEAIEDVAIDEVGQLQHVALGARDIDPHDRLGARIDLGDLGRLGLFGQVVEHARDAIANIVGGAIDVATQAELDGDARTLVRAHRRQLGDAFDAGNRVLDRLRDLRFHDRRGRSAIQGIDTDDRRLNVRQLAH
jgi:hypothetical protein